MSDSAELPSTGWRSWHLHVDTFAPVALDDVVTQVIGPLADEMGLHQSDGPRWFFIRYWLGGPHVRLRIADLTESQADWVEASLAARLHQIDAALPRSRRLTQADYERVVDPMVKAGEGGVPVAAGKLVPPGVQRATYEPEYQRYGGRHLMPASERLFHHSSRVALSVCQARAGTRHGLASGMEATAAACSALEGGASPVSQRDFLTAQRDMWLRWAQPKDSSADHSAEAIRALTEVARKQCLALGTFASSLSDSLRQGDPRWAAWTDPLRSALRAWTAELGTARAIGIFGSQVHMTANRLGVGAGREAHVAALLLALLDSAAAGKPPIRKNQLGPITD
ncbi:thiopeptide-type bacteriocin biosynthesis protein [Streptomyces griseorubiginosus]|uniref:thiopeptide-type bacteriocin biosynthesis protein n=1 Tax=Streptomyces griseorubiginosus TaxID=67304 RepID=UPI0036E5AEE8